MSIHPVDFVRTFRGGFLRRRLLTTTAMSLAAAGSLGHFPTLLADQAGALKRNRKSMILLWMQGGPSQFETLDPKPGTDQGGPTEAIETVVPGIRIAENFPQVAKQLDKIAIIRSMTNKEGSHPRATYQLHTGYVPAGSVKHPSFGSNIAHQLGNAEGELPSFVSIGATQGAGFLGMDYEPFHVSRPGQMPDNVSLTVSPERFARRSELLGKLTQQFAASGSKPLADTHASLYGKSSRLIRTPEITAFDIASEPSSLRDEYGDSGFGRGCLLARRLVERGVTFVEVRSGNWDTHQNNFEECAKNASETDPATAALLRDLNDRGMLENTLVVWMGEFGRTPKINPREGRDHYPKVFSMMLAGSGIRGGQVYGASTPDGTDVRENPVTVPDLLRTCCRALGVNPDHENMSPQGRPLRIVDGGRDIETLFS